MPATHQHPPSDLHGIDVGTQGGPRIILVCGYAFRLAEVQPWLDLPFLNRLYACEATGFLRSIWLFKSDESSKTEFRSGDLYVNEKPSSDQQGFCRKYMYLLGMSREPEEV